MPQSSSYVLRELKTALRDRNPHISSSHLSEALAAGLGYRTYAALLAANVQSQLDVNWTAFASRIAELGHPVFEPVTESLSAPYLERQALIQSLETDLRANGLQVRALWAQCVDDFARQFGLGEAESEDIEKAPHRYAMGVDHRAAIADWGTHVNHRHSSLIAYFSGADRVDHITRFYTRLPLADGRFVAARTAFVSQPYELAVHDFNEIRRRAAEVGWTVEDLTPWAWYAVGKTRLHLYRRTTSTTRLLRDWDGSFSQWLWTHMPELKRRARGNRRKVLEDAADCTHVPFDLIDFEDCRERYLTEFAPSLLDRSDTMARAFEKLMGEWRAASAAA